MKGVKPQEKAFARKNTGEQEIELKGLQKDHV